jgi:NAD-dependent deacetylase
MQTESTTKNYKHVNRFFDELTYTQYLQGLVGDDKYEALNEMVDASKKIVFFGGAGVSTDSGIPDFRSKDGLYNQHDVRFDMYQPEYLLSRDCLYNNPKVFYEFYRQKMDTRNILPNDTHKILAKLEEAGKLEAIITQNIDCLHQKAGSKKVYEIHGTTARNYCVKCCKEYPADYIFTNTDAIPRCTEIKANGKVCNSPIRADVTLYGENLPSDWDKANEVILDADMLIVGGTSLTVFQATYIVSYFHGRHLVIINRDETPYDQYASLVFHENISDVLKKINI